MMAAAEPASTAVDNTPVSTPSASILSAPAAMPAIDAVERVSEASDVEVVDDAVVADETVDNDIDLGVVDLSSLIKPVPRFESITLEAVSSVVAVAPKLSNVADAIDTFDLSDLLSVSTQEIDRVLGDLMDAFDQQRDAVDDAASFAQTLVGATASITSGLTVGYLIWLIRGGTLMGSVLSSLPAWRLVDPLPVLASLAEDVTDEDDESLEGIVDHQPERAAVAQTAPNNNASW